MKAIWTAKKYDIKQRSLVHSRSNKKIELNAKNSNKIINNILLLKNEQTEHMN